MRKLLLSMLIATLSITAQVTTKADSFNISSQKHSTIKGSILCVNTNDAIKKFAKIIQDDLEFTDQISMKLQETDQTPSATMLASLFKSGTSLCLCCTLSKDKKKLSVQLFETHAIKPIYSKDLTYKDKTSVYDAHSISDDLIPMLTGHEGIALSTLAYCKQFSFTHKGICLADYAGWQEKVTIKDKGLNVAPRWHSQLPQLFYSQLSQSKGNLYSLTIPTKKKSLICAYDGLNMQPSFSEDGKKVALCLSARKGNTELYLFDEELCKKLKKRTFVPLTSNGGNNSSPCYLSNGNIIFCSDFQSGSPQLYYLDTKKKKTYRLTNGAGYCAAPSYHEATQTITYIRPINKTYQLHTMQLTGPDRLVERQCTFGSGDKLDPAWSPCGNYIAFTYDYVTNNKRIPQIAIFNCASKKIRIVTKDPIPKSFPTWTNKPFYHL